MATPLIKIDDPETVTYFPGESFLSGSRHKNLFAQICRRRLDHGRLFGFDRLR